MSEKGSRSDKITPEQAKHVRAKAVRNIARSLIRRAEGVGTTLVDGKLVNITKTYRSTGKEYVAGRTNRPVYQQYRSTATETNHDSRVLKVEGYDYPSRSDSLVVNDINDHDSKIHLSTVIPNPKLPSEGSFRIAIDPATDSLTGVNLGLGGRRGGGRIAEAELTGKVLTTFREQREVLSVAEQAMSEKNLDQDLEKVK